MKSVKTPVANASATSPDSEPIAKYDLLVVWMFLFIFLLFGVITLGDLLIGLFR